MYIFITEDGEVGRMDQYTQDDLKACDDGILDIIRVDGPLPMRYFDNVWEPLSKFE